MGEVPLAKGVNSVCLTPCAPSLSGWRLSPSHPRELNHACASSLIAGILIFIVPRLLNYIVAIYLIAMGLIGLFGTGAFH